MWIVVITIGMSYYYKIFVIKYPIDKSLLIDIPDKLLANLPFPDFSMVTDMRFYQRCIGHYIDFEHRIFVEYKGSR